MRSVFAARPLSSDRLATSTVSADSMRPKAKPTCMAATGQNVGLIHPKPLNPAGYGGQIVLQQQPTCEMTPNSISPAK